MTIWICRTLPLCLLFQTFKCRSNNQNGVLNSSFNWIWLIHSRPHFFLVLYFFVADTAERKLLAFMITFNSTWALLFHLSYSGSVSVFLLHILSSFTLPLYYFFITFFLFELSQVIQLFTIRPTWSHVAPVSPSG